MRSPLEIFAKVEPDEKLFDVANWATYAPLFGLGHTKPNHYLAMLEVLRDNKDELGFAWRILRDGCCDGCALGTSGLADWTVDGVHLCTVRLNMLRLNTMGALNPDVLAHPDSLRAQDGNVLRDLGRLPYPMVWRRGERGYRRVSWDDAIDLVAGEMRAVRDEDPNRMSTYLTSRGLPNETYYAFQKVMRWLGTNNVDTSARICHSPSTSALKKSVGDGATNISYTDWIGTDLLLLIGTNMANNQPVTMKYIYHAKKAGTRVVVINPYREEGLDKYWVPSNLESALFGTQIMDDFYQVRIGGDAAFFNGALKHLIETDQLDRDFIDANTEGFDDVARHLASLEWSDLAERSGVSEREIREFADLYGSVDTSVSVWSMGITQHSYGFQNVCSISNLALSQGRIGREKCGLNPIRGHSGVQGGAEMGATPTQYGKGLPVTDPEVRAQVSDTWGFDVPDTPGLGAVDTIDAMYDGNIDLLYCVGGNFLQTLPQPRYVAKALQRTPVRVFQDIVINPMMLMEPEKVNVILPAATRYETPGGVTETSTERRVIFSPEIPGRRVGEARPEWEIPVQIARRVDPDRAHLIAFGDTDAIRADVSDTIPAYRPMHTLRKKGDQFQWGGERLYEDYRFNTDDEKAHFVPVNLHDKRPGPGQYHVTTRRGKQFNSMVWGESDPLNDAERDAVFISPDDARDGGFAAGDRVVLKSDHGTMEGRLFITDRLHRGNLQVHWPEAQGLIARGVTDPTCGIPEYDAFADLLPADTPMGDGAAG